MLVLGLAGFIELCRHGVRMGPRPTFRCLLTGAGIQLSSESALTLEGPLFKSDKSEANTSYIISVRRSYLQLLFQAIGLPFLPDYWDYQYKVIHQINSNNELLKLES